MIFLLNKTEDQPFRSTTRKWYESDTFTDEITYESSEFSIESDEILNSATALTSQFRIIPSGIYGNCPFHTLNNIVFEGQLTAKRIWNEKCDFIFKRRNIDIFVKEI